MTDKSVPEEAANPPADEVKTAPQTEPVPPEAASAAPGEAPPEQTADDSASPAQPADAPAEPAEPARVL